MSTEIQISVCITTFNSVGYICASLTSVIKQNTNFAFEIIIADDASQDKTVELALTIIKEANFENYKVIANRTNRGINSNLLSALRECKGRYVALLDADDLWSDTNKLQSQFNILTENSEIDFCYTNFIYKFTDDNSQTSLGMPTNFIHPNEKAFDVFLITPYICICTLCFKRHLLDYDLIDEFIRQKFISQDYPILLHFSKNYIGYYDTEVTTKITLKPNSISRPNILNDKLIYFNKIYEIGTYFIELYGASNKTKRLRSFKHHFKYLLALWTTLDFIQVKDYSKNLKIKEFLKFNPKATYIYIASKNKYLYKLLRPWVLRKRPPGQ